MSPGLQLDFDGNLLGAEGIKILEDAWAFYYADQQNKFLNCIALYHGQQQANSLVSCLPPKILLEIYRYVLSATSILAKMTEISAKIFRQQSALLENSNKSPAANQLVQVLATALSAEMFTEKAAKIKTSINHFLQQELGTSETEKMIKLPTVALLRKYHLLTGNSVHQDLKQSDLEPPLKRLTP